MTVVRRVSPMRVVLYIVFVGVLIFLFLPLIVVIPISFNPGTVLRFPPDGISLRWYNDFFGDQRWLDAAWLSLRLGITVAILATVLALGAAVALTRFVTVGKPLLRALILSPLIVPLIVTSIAVFEVFNELGLLRSFWGLVLAHTILALPFGVIIIESALRNVDVTLEEAAMSLGASRLVAFRRITVPLIAPGLFGAAVIAFITSWDEVVMVLFVGGARNQTLPVRMFQFLETQIRPTIAAISTLLIVALLIALVLRQLLILRQRRRMGSVRSQGS